MRGLVDLLNRLFEAAGIHLDPWMAPAAALALATLFLPLILRNMRTSRARKLLKQAGLLAGPEGAELERRALDLVGDHAVGLVAIADEALRRGRTRLARAALERLVATGRERRAARRIFLELEGRGLPPTAEEAALAIDHLVEAGMVAEAASRLARARRIWPASPALDEAAARLEAAVQHSGDESETAG